MPSSLIFKYRLEDQLPKYNSTVGLLPQTALI
jgi:hypothetical protein